MSIHLREIAIRAVPIVAAVALVAGLQHASDAGALGLAAGLVILFGGMAALVGLRKRD